MSLNSFSKHMAPIILFFLQHKHKGTLLILWRTTDHEWDDALGDSCERTFIQSNAKKCSSYKGARETSFSCLKINWNVYFFLHIFVYRLYLKAHTNTYVPLHLMDMPVILIALRLGFKCYTWYHIIFFPVVTWLSDPLEILKWLSCLISVLFELYWS